MALVPTNLVTNVCEFEEVAKSKLPKMVYDYYASGAEDQWTLKENRHAFERIRSVCLLLGSISEPGSTEEQHQFSVCLVDDFTRCIVEEAVFESSLESQVEEKDTREMWSIVGRVSC